MKFLLMIGLASMLGLAACARERPMNRPDGKIEVGCRIAAGGTPVYDIWLDGRQAIRESRLGIVRRDADFTRNLAMVRDAGQERIHNRPIRDEYEILTAKRRRNTYVANQTVHHLKLPDGKRMDILFQVSNEGVAFRYHFPGTSGEAKQIIREATSFKMPDGTSAFLQPMQESGSGWERSNPAYEEFYLGDIPVGTQSTLKAGWVFPALFREGNRWLLVSETALGRGYCGSKLAHESPGGEYFIELADKREVRGDGPSLPQSPLPWTSPWRVIVLGSLKTIAESTLGTDLADKARSPLTGILPGRASWSWPLLGDSRTTYDVQKQFIDYAADMGWEYCLIDALWDRQIGYDRIRELCDYAATRNVGVLVWYNSAGDWNTTPQTPRDRMLTHESRVAEFDRLQSMGVKGLKIDFFGGDGQSMIDYYLDILEDAAPYGFLINFHGATLPRGWQRTYPHLMTMEAVKGFEYVTFGQENADHEPSHAAMLPFTRNVFDPMDFTPVCLDRVSDRIRRKTTSAFELALSVIFTSGIQHYPEIPAGMAKMPDYVKDFMKKVPSIWDDSRFLAGYPGRYVVMARQKAGKWFVAGINGEDAGRALTLDLAELRAAKGKLITDGDGELFRKQEVEFQPGEKYELTLKPNGGFVLTLQ